MKKFLALSIALLTLAGLTAQAAIILSDDFADVVKTSSPATFASGWNTVNGITAPASSLTFFNASFTPASSDDGAELGFHNNGLNPGMIDVNNNMTAGGWRTSIALVLDGSTGAIDLTSLSLDMRLTNGSGAGQSTSSKSGRMTVELVGSSSGVLGTVDPGNLAYPTVDYPRTLDLSGLHAVGTSEPYTMNISALGTGFGHHKALDALTLEGTVTAIPEPGSLALLASAGLLALLFLRRK